MLVAYLLFFLPEVLTLLASRLGPLLNVSTDANLIAVSLKGTAQLPNKRSSIIGHGMVFLHFRACFVAVACALSKHVLYLCTYMLAWSQQVAQLALVLVKNTGLFLLTRDYF